MEKVQNRAARFVTRDYTFEEESMTGILEQLILKWESLKKRRNRLLLLYKGLRGNARIPTDDLIPPRLGVVEIVTPRHFSFHLLVQRPIKVVSFPRQPGTRMFSLTLRFLLLKFQMIVCPRSLHSCVLGTNFSQIRTPGEIMSFGVSQVNYSDSNSYFCYKT